MGKLTRIAIVAASAVLASAAVIYLQYRFDAADRRHGLEVVQGYHPRGGSSIPERIELHHPGRAVGWRATTESSCMQHVRVSAVVSSPAAGQPSDYQFVVDINEPSIHPGNEAGRRLLGELGAGAAGGGR